MTKSGASSGAQDIILCQGSNITLSASGSCLTINSTGVTQIVAGNGLSGGTITSSGTISLPATGPGAATYGCDDTNCKIDTITLDAYGRITALTCGPISTGTGATYTTSVPSSTTKLRLTGSDSTTDDIEFVGGTGITVSRKSASAICICATTGTGTVQSGLTGEAAYYTGVGTVVNGAAGIHIEPGTNPGGIHFWNCSSSGSCALAGSSDASKGSLYSYGSSRHPYWRDGSGTHWSVCINMTSDYRYKTNLTSWPSLCCSTNVIKNTPVYRFNWNEVGGAVNPLEGTSANKVGFLAHELQAQLSNTNIVRGEKDATNAEGAIIPQSIDEKGLIAVLWAALQENIEKLEDLEERVKTLESN
jgi:hypothetical protein